MSICVFVLNQWCWLILCVICVVAVRGDVTSTSGFEHRPYRAAGWIQSLCVCKCLIARPLFQRKGVRVNETRCHCTAGFSVYNYTQSLVQLLHTAGFSLYFTTTTHSSLLLYNYKATFSVDNYLTLFLFLCCERA